jgi:hypothetical protein
MLSSNRVKSTAENANFVAATAYKVGEAPCTVQCHESPKDESYPEPGELTRARGAGESDCNLHSRSTGDVAFRTPQIARTDGSSGAYRPAADGTSDAYADVVARR